MAAGLADGAAADTPPHTFGHVSVPFGNEAVPDDSAPYGMRGRAVDIVARAADVCGIDIAFTPMPLRRGKAEIRAGNLDGWLLLARSPSRDTDFLFHHTPLLVDEVIMASATRRGLDFQSLEALPQGTVIGILTGMDTSGFAASMTHLQTRQITNTIDIAFSLAQMLVLDRIDYMMVSSRSAAQHQVDHLGLSAMVTLHATPVEQRAFYLALGRTERGLRFRDCMNRVLPRMTKATH